jgi:hypothetical protein
MIEGIFVESNGLKSIGPTINIKATIIPEKNTEVPLVCRCGEYLFKHGIIYHTGGDL